MKLGEQDVTISHSPHRDEAVASFWTRRARRWLADHDDAFLFVMGSTAIFNKHKLDHFLEIMRANGLLVLEAP